MRDASAAVEDASCSSARLPPLTFFVERFEEMKIHQLPMGARFVFEGEEYVKTGPMVATGKSGQRLIPKYAVLKPLGDAAAAPAAAPSDTLTRASVLAAFDAFHARCEALVAEDSRGELEAARAEFFAALA